MNRSVKDALVAEEKFFRSRPVQSYCPLTDFLPGFHLQIVYLFIMLLQVYNGLADRCGITQLAKKLNQVEYLWHSCMSVSWNRVYSFRWFISEIWFYLVFFNMFLHCAYGLCGLLCLQIYKPFPLSSSLSYVSFSMWGLASFLVLLSLLEICTFVNFRPMLLIISTFTFHLLWLILIFIQILVQHIKTVLPGLKLRMNSALVSVAKEHASIGEIPESKACFIFIF